MLSRRRAAVKTSQLWSWDTGWHGVGSRACASGQFPAGLDVEFGARERIAPSLALEPRQPGVVRRRAGSETLHGRVRLRAVEVEVRAFHAGEPAPRRASCVGGNRPTFAKDAWKVGVLPGRRRLLAMPPPVRQSGLLGGPFVAGRTFRPAPDVPNYAFTESVGSSTSRWLATAVPTRDSARNARSISEANQERASVDADLKDWCVSV